MGFCFDFWHLQNWCHTISLSYRDIVVGEAGELCEMDWADTTYCSDSLCVVCDLW